MKSATLAQSVVAELSFVRRSLSKLVKVGPVEATRGKNGACHLARPPGDLGLLEIYRASTAPAVFAVHDYPIEKKCPISSNIKGCLATVQVVARIHPLDIVPKQIDGPGIRFVRWVSAGPFRGILPRSTSTLREVLEVTTRIPVR